MVVAVVAMAGGAIAKTALCGNPSETLIKGLPLRLISKAGTVQATARGQKGRGSRSMAGVREKLPKQGRDWMERSASDKDKQTHDVSIPSQRRDV